MKLIRYFSNASIFVAVIIFSCASAFANTCTKGPDDFFLYDTEPQAKGAGVNYRTELISAFKKNAESLSILLRVTASGKLDGAGAQSHSDVLLDLLKCWGDDEFTIALGHETLRVRRAVLKQFQYATDEEKETRVAYPKTFASEKPLTRHSRGTR